MLKEIIKEAHEGVVGNRLERPLLILSSWWTGLLSFPDNIRLPKDGIGGKGLRDDLFFALVEKLHDEHEKPETALALDLFYRNCGAREWETIYLPILTNRWFPHTPSALKSVDEWNILKTVKPFPDAFIPGEVSSGIIITKASVPARLDFRNGLSLNIGKRVHLPRNELDEYVEVVNVLNYLVHDGMMEGAFDQNERIFHIVTDMDLIERKLLKPDVTFGKVEKFLSDLFDMRFVIPERSSDVEIVLECGYDIKELAILDPKTGAISDPVIAK